MERKLWGTFARFIILPAHIVQWQTFVIPADISCDLAALLDPLASVFHAWQSIPLSPPGGAVILGTAAIAFMHAFLAVERGFSPVMVVGRRPHRFPAFQDIGVEPLSLCDTLREDVRRLTDGLGAEVVIDTTGAPDLWQTSLSLCRGGGTCVAFAGCEEGTEACLDTTLLHYEQLTVVGSFHYTRRAVTAAHEAITRKIYPLDRLISGTYPLEALPEAMEELRSGKGFKYVIRA